MTNTNITTKVRFTYKISKLLYSSKILLISHIYNLFDIHLLNTVEYANMHTLSICTNTLCDISFLALEL